ncbi:MAG: 3-dehydroquinate synthase [Pacificimonas sp.]
MTRIDVDLAGRSYPILIEPGLLTRVGEHLPPPSAGRPHIVVTDEAVAGLHLDPLRDGLGHASETIILPVGETTKSWPQLEALVERLLALGVERGDTVIALGGGVIGDLTGFAASILRRGCRFAQIPTTLLAQVDSSVGGKTAINTAAGKNLVGAFHQPSVVLIDPEVLTTLPERQLHAGYAEVVKYGLIRDAPFFAWCEENGQALLGGDSQAQVHAIATSCATKAAVVAEDERETTGARALLNLGHTFGHALEAEGGYSDRLLHGEAVSIGMLLAFRYSARTGLCDDADVRRIERHFDACGQPTLIPEFANNANRLVAHMRQDKKASAGDVPLILTHGIGRSFLSPNTDLADVEAFLAERIAADHG